MNVTVQANLRRKVYYLALLTRRITGETRRFAFIRVIGYTFSVKLSYAVVEPPLTAISLATASPHIYSYSTTATSLPDGNGH